MTEDDNQLERVIERFTSFDDAAFRHIELHQTTGVSHVSDIIDDGESGAEFYVIIYHKRIKNE